MFDNQDKTMLRRATLPVLFCLISLVALAQTSARKKPVKEPEIETKKVAIDAIVTGAGGAVTPGLTAADFEIVQEGQKQKIVEVSFVHPKSGIGPSLPAGGPVRWPGMELSQDARNMMVIVVDDLSLTLQGWLAVRAAISGFVNEKMRPGGFLSIVPVSGGPVYLQQFTADKERLQAALTGVKFQPQGALGEATSPREQSHASTAVLSLQAALHGLQTVPGRKTVVFFSQNMWLYRNPQVLDWFGRYDEFGLRVRRQGGEALASLTEFANLASVVFYTVDPRGLIRESQDKDQMETYGGLGRLAKDTGGIFFDNTNDAARALERVEQEMQGYYRIVFASTTSNTSGSLPFLRASVKVLRDGLNVRTRSGLLKLTEDLAAFDPGQSLGEMMNVVSSPFSFGDVRLGLNATFTRSPRNDVQVDILMLLRMEDISYVLGKDGLRHSTIEMIIALVDQTGVGGARPVKGYEMKLKPEEYARAIRFGLPIRARLTARKAGVYRVVGAVRDLTSGKIGAGSRFVEIPDLQSGTLLLSGVAVSGDQPGYALDTTSSADSLAKDEALMLAPVGQAQAMRYSYQVFNARGGEDKIARLDAGVRLFRNGEQIYSGQDTPISYQAQATATRATISGRLMLKESMAPGDYSLQVIVKDRLAAEGTPRTASQYINFEVQ